VPVISPKTGRLARGAFAASCCPEIAMNECSTGRDKFNGFRQNYLFDA
jgi:hypothetical protein